MARRQTTKLCPGCNTLFKGKATAVSCSPTCRKRLHRAKQALRHEVESVKVSVKKGVGTLENAVEANATEEGFIGLPHAAFRPLGMGAGTDDKTPKPTPSAAPAPGTDKQAASIPVSAYDTAIASPSPQAKKAADNFEKAPLSAAPSAGVPAIPGAQSTEIPLVPEAEELSLAPKVSSPSAAIGNQEFNTPGQPISLDTAPAPTSRPPHNFYNPIRSFAKHRYVTLVTTALLASGLLFAAGIYYLTSQENQQTKANIQAAAKTVDLHNTLQADPTSKLVLGLDTKIANGKNLTATGQVVIQNETDSTTALTVQNAAGNTLLAADTKDQKVGIGTDPTGPALLQVAGDISTKGSVISDSGAFSLSSQGLTINSILICSATGCKSTAPAVDTSIFAALNANQTFTGVNTFKNLQVNGNLNATGAYQSNGVSGTSLTCPSGYALTNAVVDGGLTVGGVCTSVTASSTPSLQQVYGSSVPARITLSSSSGALDIQDGASPLGTNLFEVRSNGGVATYFSVNASGIAVGGNVNTTGQYQVGGAQISSANLSNDSNLAKLNGTQTFTGANTLSNASNSFTGSGAGLTSVNAATLQGNNGAYFTNATNISTGTLADTRLSTNVTLQGNTFNGASQLVQLTAGGFLPVVNGSNLTSLNGSQITSGTVADVRLSNNVALLNGTGPQTFSGNNKFSGTVLAQNTVDSTTAFQLQNATGTSNLLVADTTNTKIGIGLAPSPTGAALQVSGAVNVTSNYSVGGTAGSGVTCAGGNVLSNIVVSGGIVTGGSCAVNGAGATTTLQQAYDNSSSPATITTSAAAKGIIFKAGTGNDSTSLFQIQNAAGSSLINVDSSSSIIKLAGNNSGALGAWSTNTNALPVFLSEHNSFVANGYVYVVGGQLSNASYSTATYYAKLNADGSVGTWATTTSPASLRHASLVVANGYVYFIGGIDGGGVVQSTVYYAKINADGSLSNWSTNANTLPGARVEHTSATANGYIYVMGGSNGPTAQSTVYYARVNADGSTGAWSTNVNALPAASRGLTSVVANGYLYALTGSDNLGNVQSAVYYAKLNADGSTGTWTTNVNGGQGYVFATSVVSNGYVYVMGGSLFLGGAAQSAVSYAKLNADGGTGAWTTNANALPAVRVEHTSVVSNGYVYVIGGSTGQNSAGGGQSSVYYSSASRLQIGANLDLVGLQGQTLADSGELSRGSTGGSITAGNGTFVGSLQVQGSAAFAQGLSANGNLTIGGSALFQNSANSTTAFQVQSAAGNNYIQVDTSGANLYIGNTGIASTIQVGTTTGAVVQTINIGTNATASSTTTIVIGSTIGASGVTIKSGTGDITLTGHLKTNDGVITSSIPLSCGTGAGRVQSGTDTAGLFQINAGTGTPGNCSITISFGTAYNTAPSAVLISPAGSTSGARQAYVSSITTTGFTVVFAVAPPASESDPFYYWVIE